MKISSKTHVSKTSFRGYYDAEKLRQFEKLLDYYRKTNPYLKKTDIVTMRNSISSYNAFLKGAESVNPVNVENQIYKRMGIPAHFENDKYLASLSAITLNIFKKLRLPLPAGLKKAPLEPNVRASCSTADRVVTFNSLMDWSDTQEEQILERMRNFVSSGHFLRTPIHEFMHSVHLVNLHKLAGAKQQLVDNLHGKWLKKALGTIDFKTKMINEGGAFFRNGNASRYIYENVSGYGATRPVEMFADKGAQMIADVLNYKTLLPKNNPFVFKDFTEDKYLMKMLDDFWMGNFSNYI